MRVQMREAARLLETQISETPLALHGTGVESAIGLFDTGVLPTGNGAAKATKDHLYFVPVQRRFKGTRWYARLNGFTPSHALKSAVEYAHTSVDIRYLVEQLGRTGVAEAFRHKISMEWIYGSTFRIPREEREKAERLDIRAAMKEIRRRKGVLIEVNEGILDFRVSLDPSGDGIRIYCPNGLEIGCVDAVRPLGKIESEIIEGYLKRK